MSFHIMLWCRSQILHPDAILMTCRFVGFLIGASNYLTGKILTHVQLKCKGFFKYENSVILFCVCVYSLINLATKEHLEVICSDTLLKAGPTLQLHNVTFYIFWMPG